MALKTLSALSVDQKEEILHCSVSPNLLLAGILMHANIMVYVVSNNAKLGCCQASLCFGTRWNCCYILNHFL